MDDFQEMISRLQRPLSNAQEIQRLSLLLDGADKLLRKTETDIEQIQVDSAQERVEYFEKLTIGAGAAIAAIVTFLGSHSTTLHPHWILRSSLVFLGFAMLAGLFRNFRYPNYVMQIRKVSWIKATLYQAKCRLDLMKADPAAVDIRTGQVIDIVQKMKEFAEDDKESSAILKQNEEIGERLRKQWTYAEWFCLTFLFLEMVSLVWLALANF